MAVSMGWIMPPATHSVMGSVPEEKSGVASAMNDVTRQVAGALLEAARSATEESVGQAQAVAVELPAAVAVEGKAA